MYEKPKDLIPRDTMVLFLTDMYLAVASKNTKHKTTNKKNNYMPLVYEKYKIDSTRFYTSNNFYTSKIEDYSDILTIVKSNIKEKNEVFVAALSLKDSLKKAKKQKRIRLKDSLKNAKLALRRLPAFLKRPVLDTVPFYDNKDVYLSNVEKYEHILIVKTEEEFEFEEEDEKESKSKKTENMKVKDAIEAKKLKKIKEELKKKKRKKDQEE